MNEENYLLQDIDTRLRHAILNSNKEQLMGISLTLSKTIINVIRIETNRVKRLKARHNRERWSKAKQVCADTLNNIVNMENKK